METFIQFTEVDCYRSALTGIGIFKYRSILGCARGVVIIDANIGDGVLSSSFTRFPWNRYSKNILGIGMNRYSSNRNIGLSIVGVVSLGFNQSNRRRTLNA